MTVRESTSMPVAASVSRFIQKPYIQSEQTHPSGKTPDDFVRAIAAALDRLLDVRVLDLVPDLQLPLAHTIQRLHPV